MKSITTTWTAQNPFAFAMPISGHAFAATTPRGAVTGIDLGLGNGYSRGTTAWRPPTC